MKKKCVYMYCFGYDVKCSLTGLTLGDIMGYDGKACAMCQQTYKKKASALLESRLNVKKLALSSVYGKHNKCVK